MLYKIETFSVHAKAKKAVEKRKEIKIFSNAVNTP
jgi:hypothetical protein